MIRTQNEWTLVYDLDGTLVDSAPDLHLALNHTLASIGLGPVQLDDIRNMIGDGAKALIRKGLTQHQHPIDDVQIDSQLWPLFIDYYAENADRLSQTFAGADACLREFQSSGYTQVVCTNKAQSLAEIVIRGLGIEPYFAALSGGDTYTYRKPDGRHILTLLEQAGRSASKAIMIGDSETDERAARNAGLPFVFVSFGYGQLSKKDASDTIIVNHWNDMPRAIARITS